LLEHTVSYSFKEFANMPLTPFHLSSTFLLYFKAKRHVDPLALAVSATFIDLEPLYYWVAYGVISHRVWHGYALALTIFPILVTVAVYLTEHAFGERLLNIYRLMGLQPDKAKYPALNIYLISVFGGFTHIFLDMFSHANMMWVLYPLAYGNPFYSRTASTAVEVLVALLSTITLILWLKSVKEHLSGTRRTERAAGTSPRAAPEPHTT